MTVMGDTDVVLPGAGPGDLGSLLSSWRTRRRLTLGQLSRMAGVHKSSLSRWEAGGQQPRMIELEATLHALGVGPAESALAFSCITAPRGLRHHRTTTATTSPLTRGDLLRALRYRKGWSQAQTAHKIDVVPHTIARWELGERIPSSDQIQALCSVLGAQDAERAALASDNCASSPIGTARTWDEAFEQLQPLIASVRGSSQPLHELFHYLLDQEIWRFSLSNPEARRWLIQVRIWHAHYHRLYQHWGMVGQLLNKTREVATEKEMPLELSIRFMLLSTALAVYGGRRPMPEQGIPLLQSCEKVSRSLPDYHAWVLSDMAHYAAMGADFDSALSFAGQAYGVAKRTDHWLETWLRACDLGCILVKAGRAGEALDILPDPTLCDSDSREEGIGHLHWAEAYHTLGMHTDAATALTKAHSVLEKFCFPPEKHRVTHLASLLS